MAYVGKSVPSKGTAAYAHFGHQASDIVLSSIARLPTGARAKNMKILLDEIDPSLWSRTQTIKNQLQKQGVPAQQALKQGLSRAMGAGLAAEVVKTGQKNRVPKKGLLGLGMYGPRKRARLGLGDTTTPAATPAALTAAISKGLTQSSAVANVLATTQIMAPPAVGTCDATGTFIYDQDAASGAMYWRRKTATDVCTGTYGGGPQVITPIAGGGVTIYDPGDRTDAGEQGIGLNANQTVSTDGEGLSTDSAPGAAAIQMLQVGPFAVPMGGEMTIHWTGLLPDDWIAFVAPELATDCQNCVITSLEPSTPGHPLGIIRDFLGPAAPTMCNKDLVAIGVHKILGMDSIPVQINGQTVMVNPSPMNIPDQPIAGCDINGEEWGFYLTIAPQTSYLPWDSVTNPNMAYIKWRKAPQGIWDFIKKLNATILHWVGEALQQLGDLACSITSTNGGKAGATVVGGVVGGYYGGAKGAEVGAQVGSTGANVIAQQCGSTQTCPTGTIGTYPNCVPIDTTPPWLWPLAIGGAALFVTMTLLGRHHDGKKSDKKKKAKAAAAAAAAKAKAKP